MHHEMSRLDLRDFVVREVVYSPGLRMPRHAHQYSNVTVVVAGEIEEHADGGTHRGRAGSVVVKPAGCEHENGVSGFGARTLSIELTRGAIADEVARRSWSWLEHPAVVRAALALCRANERDAEARAQDLLAAVLAMPRGSKHAPRWLAQIVTAIEQRFDEPLRLESLARDLGLHPVYVSRAFRQHVGMTMHEFLRGLRLRHARHLLSASKRSVTAIAAISGFSDTAHLSRTFNQQFGVSPKCFRKVQSIQFARESAS
jgi:AraC family transcriptional regulator